MIVKSVFLLIVGTGTYCLTAEAVSISSEEGMPVSFSPEELEQVSGLKQYVEEGYAPKQLPHIKAIIDKLKPYITRAAKGPAKGIGMEQTLLEELGLPEPSRELLGLATYWKVSKPIFRIIARAIAEKWHKGTDPIEFGLMFREKPTWSPTDEILQEVLKQYYYLYKSYPEGVTDQILDAYNIGYSIEELQYHNLIPQRSNENALDLSNLRIDSLEGLSALDQEMLANLVSLGLSHNRLTSLEGIEQLTKLRWLNLSHNHLTSLRGIEPLANLVWLDLSHNRLTSLEGLSTLSSEQLGNLVWLDLSHNRLTSLEGIEQLTKLRWLNLSHNQLRSVEGIEPLINLGWLNLSHNQLRSIEGIEPLINLEWLDLSHNQLRSIEGIEPLIKLKGLDLSHNQLRSIEGIEPLINLKGLDLSHNPSLNPYAE